jgi:hypothetical protein
VTAAALTEPVDLHPVEVDLLCAYAEVAAPFPLDVPAVGGTERERRLLFAAARGQLAERGLADARGPLGPAAALVRLLRSGTGALDLACAAEGRDRGAVVLHDGVAALLVTQSPARPGRIVRLTELDFHDAIRELLSLVPTVDAASVPAFTLPLRPLRQVFDRIARRRPADGDPTAPQLTDSELDDLLRGSEVDEQLVARLVANLREVTGSGQLGVARWQSVPGRWQRMGAEVHWVDTSRGRFRLAQDADGEWASVHPFSRTDVRAALRELGIRARA